MKRSIKDFVIALCKSFIQPVLIILSIFMLLFGRSAFLGRMMSDYIIELCWYFMLFVLFYAYGLFLDSSLHDTRPAEDTIRGFLIMIYTVAITGLITHSLKATEMYIFCIPVFGIRIAGFWIGWYRVLSGFKAQTNLKYN